jgi:hypothetical protein
MLDKKSLALSEADKANSKPMDDNNGNASNPANCDYDNHVDVTNDGDNDGTNNNHTNGSNNDNVSGSNNDHVDGTNNNGTRTNNDMDNTNNKDGVVDDDDDDNDDDDDDDDADTSNDEDNISHNEDGDQCQPPISKSAIFKGLKACLKILSCQILQVEQQLLAKYPLKLIEPHHGHNQHQHMTVTHVDDKKANRYVDAVLHQFSDHCKGYNLGFAVVKEMVLPLLFPNGIDAANEVQIVEQWMEVLFGPYRSYFCFSIIVHDQQCFLGIWTWTDRLMATNKGANGKPPRTIDFQASTFGPKENTSPMVLVLELAFEGMIDPVTHSSVFHTK